MKKYILLVPGLVFLLIAAGLAAITTSATAIEGDEPCVPSEGTADSYTDWADEGGPVQTQTNAPPGADTDTVRWVSAGTVEVGNGDATEDTEVFDHWQRYSLTGGPWGEGVPAFPDPGDPFKWVANVQGDPHGIGVAGAYDVSNEQSGNTDWFYLEAVMTTVPGQDETFHTEYLWQKQVRTFVEGTDEVECPTPDVCPEGSEVNGGLPIPDGQTAEDYCVAGEQLTACPNGTDNAGEVIPEGETVRSFCNENENNPPKGGDEQNPPEVAGKQARVPSQAPAAPAADVPTAVDAGI